MPLFALDQRDAGQYSQSIVYNWADTDRHHLNSMISASCAVCTVGMYHYTIRIRGGPHMRVPFQ